MAARTFPLSRLIFSGLRCSTPLRPAAPPASFRTFSSTCGRTPSEFSSSGEDPNFSDDRVEWKTTAECFHLQLNVEPMSKDQVGVKMKGSELIAQGKMENNFPGGSIAVIMRYTVELPMDVIKPDEITAKVNGSILNVFIPKKKVDGGESEGTS
ncbi:Unknown protein [Striga hermonthica]|uniref:SHSP domain-containing protein n=1 Tax=Striga hermonthica TaxID=68872 RepID=A0A9N7NHA5_STRHE|nr:Unknown protein [Striga hermonthica]